MDKNALLTLATQAAEMIHCPECSFEEAKRTLVSGPYSYTFDLFSFSEYAHTMDASSYNFFCGEAIAAFERSHKKEARKAQEECSSLFAFAKKVPRFRTMKIRKCEHPDFVLEDGTHKIGIEITKLLTETESFEQTLMKEARKYGNAADAMKAACNNPRRKGAQAYTYHDIGAAIGIFNKPEPNKHAYYAQTIVTKYKKYKDMFREYDEFILLCNAMSNGLAITEEEDSNYIVSLAREAIPQKDIFDIYILRQDKQGVLFADKYRI